MSILEHVERAEPREYQKQYPHSQPTGCNSWAHSPRKPGNSIRGGAYNYSLLVTVVPMVTGNQAASMAGLLPLWCCPWLQAPLSVAEILLNLTTPGMVKVSITPSLPLTISAPSCSSSAWNPVEFRCNKDAHLSSAPGSNTSHSRDIGSSKSPMTLEAQAMMIRALTTLVAETVENGRCEFSTLARGNSSENKQNLGLLHHLLKQKKSLYIKLLETR